MGNQMTFFHTLALARLEGANITHHAASNTTQIDGSHWARWAELRKLPDPKPLVIWQGGRSVVCSEAE